MKARYIVMLFVGIIFSIIGLGLVIGGTGAFWVNSVQNDGGHISSPRERFAVDSIAITTARPEGMRDQSVPGPLPFDVGNIRIRAESASAGKDIFVGIAPRADVERYLAGSNYSELLRVYFRPFRAEYQEVQGSSRQASPTEQDFWVASASGVGEREISWNIQPGNWSVVVMNADASPGLAVDLQAGFRSELLGPIAAGLLIAGAVILMIGVPLLIMGAIGLGRHARHRSRSTDCRGDSRATARAAVARAKASQPFTHGSDPIRRRGSFCPVRLRATPCGDRSLPCKTRG